MKKIILLFVFLSVVIRYSVSNAQFVINVVNLEEVMKEEPIDDLQFTVQYQMISTPDSLTPDKKAEETMMLKVGKTSSVFYSYAKYLTDSIIGIDKATGASQDVIIGHLQQYQSKVTYKIYKNYPAGKVTTLDRLAMSNFRCEEMSQQPDWQLLSDTMTILSYPCRKAICSFKGRDYEAWFTTDIPKSEGPWKLYGLPGLILKANDTRRHYTFECTGIIQNRPGQSIQFGAPGYESISRKNLNKQFERFSADPIGYMTIHAPNVKISMKGEDGQPEKNPKNTPYNPIELDDK